MSELGFRFGMNGVEDVLFNWANAYQLDEYLST